MILTFFTQFLLIFGSAFCSGNEFRSVCSLNETTEINLETVPRGQLVSHSAFGKVIYDEEAESDVVKLSPPNFSCQWKFLPGFFVKIVIKMLELTEDCSNFLQINGEKFCGQNKPPNEPREYSTPLEITADISSQIKGFNVFFESVLPDPTDYSEEEFSGDADVGSCFLDKILSEPNGTITFDSADSFNSECSWIIDPSLDHETHELTRIDIQFLSYHFDEFQPCSEPIVEILSENGSSRIDHSACNWPPVDKAFVLETSLPVKIVFRRDIVERQSSFEIFYKTFTTKKLVILPCGVPESRVAWFENGSANAWNPSNPGSWPWHVELVYRPTGFRCVGTLVSPKWVVTAAKCFAKNRGIRSNWMLIVRPSSSNSEKPKPILPKIAKIFVHPKFMKDQTAGYDIALIRVDKGMPYGTEVKQVCLPEGEANEYDFCLSVSLDLTTLSGRFVETNMPIIDNTHCETNPYLASLVSVNDRMYCVGQTRQSRLCQGALGSSYLCYINKKWEFHGILSSSSCIDNFGTPGVFTKISAFRDNWLEPVMTRFS